jgi:hypothetical protein
LLNALLGFQHALQSGEYGDMASLFSSSSYPQQVEAYEQSYFRAAGMSFLKITLKSPNRYV